MANVKVELNYGEVRALLRSGEMMSICKELADGIKGRCGEGYKVTTHTGKNRVNAQVAAVTPHAINSNNKHNTILKAMR